MALPLFRQFSALAALQIAIIELVRTVSESVTQNLKCIEQTVPDSVDK